MSTVERITPIIARMVMVTGILTGLGSVVVAATVGEPRLLLFTGVALLSSVYGRQVTKRDYGTSDATRGERPGVQPLAA